MDCIRLALADAAASAAASALRSPETRAAAHAALARAHGLDALADVARGDAAALRAALVGATSELVGVDCRPYAAVAGDAAHIEYVPVVADVRDAGATRLLCGGSPKVRDGRGAQVTATLAADRARDAATLARPSLAESRDAWVGRRGDARVVAGGPRCYLPRGTSADDVRPLAQSRDARPSTVAEALAAGHRAVTVGLADGAAIIVQAMGGRGVRPRFEVRAVGLDNAASRRKARRANLARKGL